MLTRYLAPLADLVCLVAFAVIGRQTHESSSSGWVVLAILWPFLVAATVGWIGAMWNGMRGLRVWPGGVLILVVTYLLGMALRDVSGRGLAGGFLAVAAIFLTVTMLGWRAAYAGIVRRRS